MNLESEAFSWNRTSCAAHPLNLSATLASGQSFRWRRDAAGVWWGVVGAVAVAAWQAEGPPESDLLWQTFPEPDRWDVLADYFQLNVDLEALYAEWTAAEPRIASSLAAFRGLRILRQPPEECFFAFQCAACNTVVKIERSVRKLAERYGKPIQGVGCRVSGVGGNPMQGVGSRQSGVGESPTTQLPNYPTPNTQHPTPNTLFAFPTLDALADADEAILRADLWGYRAPRVIALARHLRTLPPDWLTSLREVPHAEAKAALMRLHGVGAKLADCICLFALDKPQAVPIDTHIRQIACRLFCPELAGKSLTPRVYEALADAYRARFGSYAGWAQQYLFFGELHRTR